MKVLITTDWYAPVINGVVTSVLNLERELRKKGHEVKILTLARGPHSYISENVYYVGSFSAGAVYPDARIKIPLHSHMIISRLIKWNPDIIHSQCEFSTFLAAKKSQRLLISQLFIPIIPFMRITRIIFLRIKNGAEKPYQNSLNGLQIHAAV